MDIEETRNAYERATQNPYVILHAPMCWCGKYKEPNPYKLMYSHEWIMGWQCPDEHKQKEENND